MKKRAKRARSCPISRLLNGHAVRSYAEVAEAMQISDRAVMKIERRALAKIRKRLGADFSNENAALVRRMTGGDPLYCDAMREEPVTYDDNWKDAREPGAIVRRLNTP